MKLNRNDIYEMVKSCLTMINEITSASAYERFYQNKIPQEKFSAFMGGQPEMTPFHKLILDQYVKGVVDDNILLEAGNIWKNASETAKQYLVFWAKEDSDNIINGQDLINRLKKIANLKGHSEKEYVDLGHEVLYEDDNVLVTCTKSYSSSCNKYGDSHWCTASDRNGEWDGFEQFGNYTGFGFLAQFIDKNNKPNYCYQVKYSEELGPSWERIKNYRPTVICDWFDKEASINDVTQMLENNGINYSELYLNYIKPNAQRLRDETGDNYRSETEFYNTKEKVRRKRFFKKVKALLDSKDTMNAVIAEVKTMIANNSSYSKMGVYEVQLYQENCLIQDLNVNTNNSNYLVGVAYLGESGGEDRLIQRIYDDYDYASSDKISRVLVLDKNLNIIGKYIGFVNPDFEKSGNITVIDNGGWPNIVVSTITGKPILNVYIDDFRTPYEDEETGKVVAEFEDGNNVRHIFNIETAQEIRRE